MDWKSMFFRTYDFQSNILSKAHPEALRAVRKNKALVATSRGYPISPLLVLYYNFHLLGLLSLKQFFSDSHYLCPFWIPRNSSYHAQSCLPSGSGSLCLLLTSTPPLNLEHCAFYITPLMKHMFSCHCPDNNAGTRRVKMTNSRWHYLIYIFSIWPYSCYPYKVLHSSSCELFSKHINCSPLIKNWKIIL